MKDEILFKNVTIKGDNPGEDTDGVAVIRQGRQVAVLPETDRLNRALNLPLDEVAYITENLGKLLKRDPTSDEREFWRAILEYKQEQLSNMEGGSS